MATRRYSSYECKGCGWKRDYILSEDPGLGPCPNCNKRNCFFVREIEKKVKRKRIRR